MEREKRSPSPEVWLTGMERSLHRARIRRLRHRILAIAGITLVTGSVLTWGLYEIGLLTQEIKKTPEDLLAEKLAQVPEIADFNRSSREFHDYYGRMFLNLAQKKETSSSQILASISAAKTAEEWEKIRQEWRKKQQFDNMALLAAERVYAIKGKSLAQQYRQLTFPEWFHQWKQSNPDSTASDTSPSLTKELLQRIYSQPPHNPAYISESRLRINAASSKVTHALEKKAQEFGIYKTSYPNGTPRNPKISDKTDLEDTF